MQVEYRYGARGRPFDMAWVGGMIVADIASGFPETFVRLSWSCHLREMRSNDTMCSTHSEHFGEIPVPVSRVGSRAPAIVVSYLNGRKQSTLIVKNSYDKLCFFYFFLFERTFFLDIPVLRSLMT